MAQEGFERTFATFGIFYRNANRSRIRCCHSEFFAVTAGQARTAR
jgi:hypothetical protein